MAKQVKVDIVCPCGKFLDYRMNDPESKSKMSGRKICPSCKKNVSYDIIGDKSYASYSTNKAGSIGKFLEAFVKEADKRRK